MSVLFHAALVGLFWLGAHFMMTVPDESAVGEPIEATLQASAADLARVRAAIAASERTPVEPEPEPEPVAAKPQPLPEPVPQTSDVPLQPAPQAPQDQPDTVDQERISRVAAEQASRLEREQEERVRQEQVDLTEDILRQQVAERRQRMREQLLEIQREREEAAKRTKREEQRLQQLADLSADAAAPPRAPARPAADTGSGGKDKGLLAIYMAAMLQTADQNWNHIGAPELTNCKVRFRQLRGGEIINVEFISCPYDEQGREFVDRALRKMPMPYAGFETVFEPVVVLTFCYPREECTR
ncbi:MAG: protein TolA [Gammaproteobacteria bacterium]|nr:protein TolA [Gammaproteobacteria bacterium]